MDFNKFFKLYKILAFIKRDFHIEASYKMGFILAIIGSLLPVFSFFFIGKLMNYGQLSNKVSLYTNNYFSYVLIGVAFAGYLEMAVGIFAGSIRRAQMAGCLEAILSSQTDAKAVVFLSSIYGFVYSAIFLIFSFFTSWLFLGFDLSKMNLAATAVAFVISLMTFISIGIFTAGNTIIFKQGDPIMFVYGGVSGIVSGALFPVALLPSWLQFISHFVPITYSLDALRLTILKGYSITMISKQLTILGSIAIILLPLSLFYFQWAVEKGKKDGTLMQY